MSERFRRVSVLGAGVMGSGIAAHLAGAGLDVLLLDIVPSQPTPSFGGGPAAGGPDRNAFARGGLDKALKSKPASFFSGRDADRVTVGNFEDDLARVGESDLVIEVVKEDLAIKRALFEQLEPLVAPHAVIASNTSGLPIRLLMEGRGESFRRRFLVTHFFNPPRYMKLLELIAGTDTDPAVVARVARFAEDVLGKGVVFGHDTPNFVANRIGAFSMMQLMHEALSQGFTVEEIDAIFGAPMGRPKSAVFRTADVVGLDVLLDVARNCHTNLPTDEQRETFRIPEPLGRMVERKLLGDKTGSGFYKKTKDGVLALDLATLEYRPQTKPKFASLGAAKGASDAAGRVKAVLSGDDRAAKLAWKVTAAMLAYSSRRLGEIADDVVNIDRAMRWGFAWDIGPFELWDALGVRATVERMEKDGFAPAGWVKELLASGKESFYGGTVANPMYFDPRSHSEKPLPESPRIVNLRARREIAHNDGASLIDLGDGVACLELHTKMNAIDGDVIKLMHTAVDRAEHDFAGLVVGNHSTEAFSAGANIFVVLVAAGQKNWAAIEAATKDLQDALMRLRHCAVPVVTAPFGLALGGGAEIAMHGAATRAHAELYMGLVEAGVGLIPAGGGCKELLARTLGHLPDGIDPFPFVQQIFMNVALGKVSMSAEEARAMGFLRDSDGVTLNRDHLLHDAKQTALGLARAGYRRPRPRTFRVPGESGYATLRSALQQMKAAHQISDHDLVVGSKLAWVLCGGRVSTTTRVTEQYILDLEREAFVSLCGEPKTQERMQYLLMNNKPLRN
ncbi:MAG: 3-hydroxyacyl-CoA dehydrogenase/enoyl-CoA hydratase family protein [Myxococcales bacterium]|nr:3-hydroxyacyl-CoA dehydrogenase/enoyl-CoA hydratase family protein [Myxococcales bacterium]